jgi:hypothetical protein
MICIKTVKPDHSDIPELHHSWENATCWGALELPPNDASKPLGECVAISHCVDANPCHDLINGKSVTIVLHIVNQTCIDLFSKLQSTAKTATCSSEFVAAKTCIKQIIDM